MSQPPQLSPDGKFYWDGERWQPMPAQAPPAPAQPKQFMDQSPINRTFSYGCGCLVALVILFWVLYFIGSFHR